jgi:hypothetical protein
MDIPLIRNRILSGLLIVAIVAVLVALQFYSTGVLNIMRPHPGIITFVLAFIFIGIPTAISLAATYFIQRRIHSGFFFRWFAASACALVMLSGNFIPMAFISDDDDDHAATTAEDFVSKWICFPIESPSFIFDNNSSPAATDPAAATAIVTFFFLPAIIWGLVFERLLNAKPLQKLILFLAIVAWAIWLAATPVKELADSAISATVTCKWAALVALTLLVAASDKIRTVIAGQSAPQVPGDREIGD